MQKACIIIPCYNEELRLKITSFTSFLKESNVALCFVNDGSIDKTIKVLENIRYGFEDKAFVVDLQKNCGKAEAVRRGVEYVLSLKQFDIIGYIDADLSTPLSEAAGILEVFKRNPEKQFVFGARVKLLGRNVVRSSTRHYFGRVFSTISSIILRLPVYDTQCGAKFFRAEIGELIFKDPLLSSWLFDVELIARLRNQVGVENVEAIMTEVPLTEWREVGGSKLRMKHFLKVPFELFRIYLKY